MPRFILGRRTFLRGAAGAAVALPPLEIMSRGKARGAAAAIPKRFCLSYAGVSLSLDNAKPVSTNLASVVPTTTGSGYQLVAALRPLGGGTVAGVPYPSVQRDAGIVSGLTIPWGSPAPPAGRWSPGSPTNAGFHGTTVRPSVSGERMNEGSIEDGRIKPDPTGSSADQIVADYVKGGVPLVSLNLRVQAEYYYGTPGDQYTISFKNGKANTPVKSLRQAYNVLFGGLAMVDGKTYDVAAFLDRRRSILDAILDKSRRLQARLGAGDRDRLDQYYDQIRTLENSLTGLKAKSGAMGCKPATAPDDPPLGEQHIRANMMDIDFTSNSAWSNEEVRAQVMADFLHLAFACDLTRTAVYHLTLAQSGMNTYWITSRNLLSDLHSAGHGSGTPSDCEEIVAWHVRHFARLAAKLRGTVEVDGSSVLDHSAMSMLFEGGYGATGTPEFATGNHSTENMIAIVAGGAGGLKSGQHIKLDNRAHPAQVVLTHMRAVGVPDTQPLGEVSDPLPELFTAG